MKRTCWVLVVSCSGWAIAQAPEPPPRSTRSSASSPRTTVSAAARLDGQPISVASLGATPKLVDPPARIPDGVHVRPASASRTCVNYIYDNAPGAIEYWPGVNLLPFETCVRPLEGHNVISCFAIELITPSQACDITAELVPHEGAAAYPGTTQTVHVEAGWWNVQFDLPTPVDISNEINTYGYITVRQTYSVIDAGPLIGEEAELGTSPNNWFYWAGGYFWFGGNPFAAFSVILFGPEETPFMGACCDQGVCFETDDYYTCEYLHGFKYWFPFESCPDFADCPLFGACCYNGTCIGDMYEADCLAQGGSWTAGKSCGSGNPCPGVCCYRGVCINDPLGVACGELGGDRYFGENCETFTCPSSGNNCGAAEPVALAPDSSYTWTGNNTGAGADCTLLGWPEVWIAFQISSTQNVRIDFCGSPLYFGNIGVWMMLDCPCANYDPADDWAWDCPDGNPHMDWYSLPAGTYYYPLYSVAPQQGDWVCTVTTTTPPPPPDNDNCGDVVPVAIPADSSYTWTGDNTGATEDCPILGHPEVWVAFQIDEPLELHLDFCGSPKYFDTVFLTLFPECPCSTYLFACYWDWFCPDGNVRMGWYVVPAGTYYYPVYSAPGYQGDYAVTVTTLTLPPPPPNDNCADAIAFNLAPGSPVTFTGDNTGATPDCSLLDWPEVWYAFTLNETLTVRVDWCGSPTYQATIGLGWAPDCPCSSWMVTSGAAWDCPDGNPHFTLFNLPAGTYYYPMYSDPSQWGPYQITFTASSPCNIDCPPGSIPEAEVCGENYPYGTNGGCDGTPPAFEPIAIGETVCGTVWADNSHRDTDWFELVLTEPKSLIWTLVGEGPMQAMIFDGTLGCDNYPLLGTATAAPCAEATIKTTPLPPGTYWFWAGLSTWGNFPCDIVYYGKLEEFIGYCDAGANTCDEHISRVQLGDFVNDSDCIYDTDPPFYADYTSMHIELRRDRDYTLTVTNGNPIWTTDTCGAWIDWNYNYSFSDPGEFYDMGSGVGPYTTTIQVPPGAFGDCRLRIRIDYVNAPSPCGISSYGEVEDYTITIVHCDMRGDVNCSGYVNAFDIDPFVRCLTSGVPTPPCIDCSYADVNCDGAINAFDIDPFVECIVHGGCP